MSCFLIGENTHAYDSGEQLNHNMQQKTEKDSYQIRHKQ